MTPAKAFTILVLHVGAFAAGVGIAWTLDNYVFSVHGDVGVGASGAATATVK